MLLSFQVSFSESGSLGNSSGSDVTSLSSQLPDTPNSMVPSPVETWNWAPQTGRSPPPVLQGQVQHDPGPLHVTSSPHRPKLQRRVFFLNIITRKGWNQDRPHWLQDFFLWSFHWQKLSRTIRAWLDMERDVQKTSGWIKQTSPQNKFGTFYVSKKMDILRLPCDIVSCFVNMSLFLIHFIALSSPVDSVSKGQSMIIC